MSFAEVLAAAKALPWEEQRKLVKELFKEDEIPEHLRQFIPKPGFAFDLWLPGTDEAGAKKLGEALEILEAGGELK